MPFVAYCDESLDSKGEKFIAFCGYVAESETWTQFAVRWHEVLDKHGIPDFHAADCHHGKGAFKGKTPKEREQIQYDLISVITSSNVHGVTSGVRLDHYMQLREDFKQFRTIPSGKAVSGSTGDPYFLSMQLLMERIAKRADWFGLPEGEKIAFVFDLQTEYQGRATAMVKALTQSKAPGMEFVKYIRQTVNYASRTGEDCFLPLQAADMLAYEHFRFAVNQKGAYVNFKKQRWQWQLLQIRNIDHGHEITDDGTDQLHALFVANRDAENNRK